MIAETFALLLLLAGGFIITQGGKTIGLVMLIVGLVFVIKPVMGHDHNRPELDSWFQSLKSGRGPCCEGPKVDALHLRDVEWETQDKPSSRYRVKVPLNAELFAKAIKGEEVETTWVDVDDSAVIDEPNRSGSPLVWPYYWLGGIGIRCFMPGTMG